MLIVEIIRYLKRRADKRPVYLKNFVDQGHHHGTRTSEPSVEIIIPTRDKFELLHACVESIINKTIYKNYSITVVNNQSKEPETLSYLADLQSRGVKIIDYPHKFNYSAICNLAASESTAEYLCFLNNDTDVVEPNWLGFMIDHAIQPSVGVVGSKLLYPNGNIQHLGVALGYRGLAGHVFSGIHPQNSAVNALSKSCFTVHAVTFACAVIASSKYSLIDGLNESLKVGLNDIDFSLNSESKGFHNVLCGKSSIIHFESMSRKSMSSFTGAIRAALEISSYLSRHRLRNDDYFSL